VDVQHEDALKARQTVAALDRSEAIPTRNVPSIMTITFSFLI
jgi:hypothetical protein